MRTAKSKSALKQSLQVCMSERNCPPPDVIIYDVSAVLWTINWPSGKIQKILDVFQARIQQALQTADVVLCFDRYNQRSIKTFTRNQRSKASRVHKLNPQMDEPAKEVCLTNTKNKIQLNTLITES